MAPDLGFLARTGWGLGSPVVSWGYGGSGYGEEKPGCVQTLVELMGEVAAAALLLGNVEVAVANLAGCAASEVLMGDAAVAAVQEVDVSLSSTGPTVSASALQRGGVSTSVTILGDTAAGEGGGDCTTSAELLGRASTSTTVLGGVTATTRHCDG